MKLESQSNVFHPNDSIIFRLKEEGLEKKVRPKIWSCDEFSMENKSWSGQELVNYKSNDNTNDNVNAFANDKDPSRTKSNRKQRTDRHVMYLTLRAASLHNSTDAHRSKVVTP